MPALSRAPQRLRSGGLLLYISLCVTANSPGGPVSTGTPLVHVGRALTSSVSDLVLVNATVLSLSVTDIFTVQETSFSWFSMCSALVFQGLSLLPEKASGLLTLVLVPCICFRKHLLSFHNSNRIPHKRNVEQVQAPDESNQDKSFHSQNMCNKEGLQIDKGRSEYKARNYMILCETWHASGLHDGTKHFMCTLLDKMELARNLGQRSRARHRIWLGQLGKAIQFRMC